jgi:Tfp pilus assembly protein PilF
MSLFLLSGMLLFLVGEKYKSWSLYFASLPAFLLALLAKETAAIFPLLLLSAEATALPSFWRNGSLRWAVRLVGPLMALGIYYLLRELFVGMTVSGYLLAAPDFFDHLFMTLKAIPLYFGLLLFPLNLHFLHPIGPSSLLDFQLWLAIFLLVGAGWGLRCAVRSDNRAVIFALLWFLIGLMPLVYFTGSSLPLLEGWIYLPSLGFFLLVAIGLERVRLENSSRICLWLALLIAVLLGGVVFYRNRDWKDDMALSLHTVAASPDDPTALRLLGQAYFRHGRTDEAEKAYQKALQSAPRDPRLNESLGRLESFLGRDANALSHYQRMRELTPNEPYPYWRVGRFLLRRRNLGEAENYFAQAAKLFPYSSEIRNDLAQTYYLQGKLDLAEAELQAALRILPGSPTLRRNLQQVLRKKG